MEICWENLGKFWWNIVVGNFLWKCTCFVLPHDGHLLHWKLPLDRSACVQPSLFHPMPRGWFIGMMVFSKLVTIANYLWTELRRASCPAIFSGFIQTKEPLPGRSLMGVTFLLVIKRLVIQQFWNPVKSKLSACETLFPSLLNPENPPLQVVLGNPLPWLDQCGPGPHHQRRHPLVDHPVVQSPLHTISLSFKARLPYFICYST